MGGWRCTGVMAWAADGPVLLLLLHARLRSPRPAPPGRPPASTHPTPPRPGAQALPGCSRARAPPWCAPAPSTWACWRPTTRCGVAGGARPPQGACPPAACARALREEERAEQPGGRWGVRGAARAAPRRLPSTRQRAVSLSCLSPVHPAAHPPAPPRCLSPLRLRRCSRTLVLPRAAPPWWWAAPPSPASSRLPAGTAPLRCRAACCTCRRRRGRDSRRATLPAPGTALPRAPSRRTVPSLPPHSSPPLPSAPRSLPFDYVKTQMQKMKPDPVTGEVPFSVSAGRRRAGGRARGRPSRGPAAGECAAPAAASCRTHAAASHAGSDSLGMPDRAALRRRAPTPHRAPWTAR